MATENAGLYLHIPFCRSKCYYCAFNSMPLGGRDPSPYVEAMLKHLAAMAANSCWRQYRFASLFFGGGTPSIIAARDLCRLLDFCLGHFAFAPEAEITLEGNPDTLSLPMLHDLRAAGVNRLSVGVQSFDDTLLAAIGRIHSSEQGRKAVEAALQAGFTNINVDLMCGLPGQSLVAHERSLETALSLGVSHLAVYELMLEEGAELPAMVAKNRLSLPEEETTVAMLELTAEKLVVAGFKHYEISNFCRPGRDCRHNINYWQNGTYLGIGAGAVSNLAGLRLVNIVDPDAYYRAIADERPPYSEAEALSNEAALRESVVMGLRMLDGIDLEVLARRYPGALTRAYEQRIDRLCAKDLLRRKKNRLRLSDRAVLLANQALAELV